MGFATTFTDAELGKPVSDEPVDAYQYIACSEREHQKRAMSALRKAMKLLDTAHRVACDARTYASRHKTLLPEYHASMILSDAMEHVAYHVRHDVNKYLQVVRPEPDQMVATSRANNI